MSETTGIWYPVSGPLAQQGTVNSSVKSAPAAAGAPTPTAAAGAPGAQVVEAAKYPQFEPISDVEVEPGALGKAAGSMLASTAAMVPPTLLLPLSTPPPPPPTPPPTSPPPPPPQQGATQTGVTMEEGDSSESDVFGMTMTYEEKLRRVVSVMSVQDKFKDLNWQPLKGKAKVASASMGGASDAKDIMGLPAAPNFIMTEVDIFRAELSSLEKSKTRPRSDFNFDGGPFPARPKFHASSYTMNDPPWHESFLSSPVQMVGTPLMPVNKDVPSNVSTYPVAVDRLHGWEASNREALAMLSYTDWFVSTVRTMMLDMANKLATNEVSVETLDGLVVDALEGVQLLESAGRGVKDLAQATVHRMCAQTLTRRDTWIKKMTQDCPREEKIQMRLSDMNTGQLVSQDLLEKAQEALQRNKTDKVHSSILKAHAGNRASRDGGKSRDRRASQKGSQDRRKINYPKEDRNRGRWQPERDGSFRGRGKEDRRRPPKGGFRGGGSNRGRGNNNNNNYNNNSGYNYY